ncbi:mediator of RNA polymerase II transcription subunit 1-domain-containing protein [Sporodiniella umbellata]|nr:mediator of RNA polymerase II transcription subunit 1-domain-containing protein [Sporodiniella umbellata]
MSKSAELPKDSISSAIIGLQNTNVYIEMHALGPVNLDKTREEFSHQINSIRNICSQFETEVLGDVMKMGAGADPAFRKHFTHLKEQAALESTVIRLKDILQSSKALLEVSLREKEESKSKAEIQRLQELAQSMGLVTFVDVSRIESDSPISTITLGGTMIVIDIDIDNKGEVQKVNVTFVSDSIQNDQYTAVDKILKENLQSRKFHLFKRNLWCLALLDQLNVKYKTLDFFLITKNLLEDLRTSCLNESEIEPDFSTVLTEGHGIPCMNLDYPGISLAYWLEKSTAVDVDWSEVQESFRDKKNHPILSKASRLLISFENSVQPMYYLPSSRPSYLLKFDETDEDIDEEHFKVVCENSYPRFMSPTRYVKTLSTHPDSVPVPIRFVATVEPPIPMADQICQSLMNVAGLTKMDTMGQSESKNASECLSLEETLVPNIAHTKHHVSGAIQMAIKANIFQTKKLYDSQVYKWMKSSNTSAKLVSRIPFQHPVQMHNILQVSY